MKNKKSLLLRIGRLTVQTLFLILLPSVYIGVLEGLRKIALAVVQLRFDASLLPAIVEVLAVVPVTILLGRFFCGWMCAFGSFTDYIYLISGKFIKLKITPGEKLDSAMKTIKYGVLAVLIIAVWGFQSAVFSTSSPWNVFGMLTAFGKAPDFTYVIKNLPIGFAIFLFIVVASMTVERFFCRYLCPLGAFFSLVSRLKPGKIRKPSAQCGNCRACTNACAMGIPLYKMDSVKSGECINCLKCVAACPRNNASYSVGENGVRPLAAGTAAVMVMTGTLIAGGAMTAGQTTAVSSSTDSVSATAAAKRRYQDGTYQGSGIGFHGGTTTVSVTIKDDAITDISTVSQEDTQSFYEQAFSPVADEILKNQSADVDAVSGATFKGTKNRIILQNN